jgi:hypothetical protein
LITKKIIANLRAELMNSIRKDVIESENNTIIEKIKNDLSKALEQKGIISNMQLQFKPDNSKMTLYIHGD